MTKPFATHFSPDRTWAAPCERMSLPISRYDQAVIKHIYRGAFDSSLDVTELGTLVGIFGAMLINVVSVYINLLDMPSSRIPFVEGMIIFVSYGEMIIVNCLLLAISLTLVQSFASGLFSTDVCVEVTYLADQLSGFSALQSIGLFTPNYFLRRVVLLFKTKSIGVGVLGVLAWLLGCGLAACSVLVKISQISFVSTRDIRGWDLADYIQVAGFLVNLAKVDQSERTELKTLLDCVHKHFAGPGGPQSMDIGAEPLTMKLRRKLGGGTLFVEFFEALYSHHGNHSNMMMKGTNFIAFIGRISPSSLRRYLQMATSPLPYYRRIREEIFPYAWNTGDLTGLQQCILDADPGRDESALRFQSHPNDFCSTLHCAS